MQSIHVARMVFSSDAIALSYHLVLKSWYWVNAPVLYVHTLAGSYHWTIWNEIFFNSHDYAPGAAQDVLFRKKGKNKTKQNKKEKEIKVHDQEYGFICQQIWKQLSWPQTGCSPTCYEIFHRAVKARIQREEVVTSCQGQGFGKCREWKIQQS